MEPREMPVSPEMVENDVTLNEIPAEATEQPTETSVDENEKNESAKSFESKDEVIAFAQTLAGRDADEVSRDEVTRVKQAFYAMRNNEIAVEREAFIAAGNDAEAFAATVDESEGRLKELLNIIKEKKAARLAEQEAERQRNLDKKKAIIVEILDIAADTDNVGKQYNRVKDLQQEFKDAGEVAPTEQSEIWKTYQAAVEHYYDQLKINKDLRDYDFRKNLDAKQLLIDEAEALATEEDVITAFRRLQELHDKWRDIGPVAKDLRDEIWNRFKDASAVVNKRYQAHFEERKAAERENEAAKTAICERVEALDFSNLKSYNAWDEMTKQIIAAQEDWKKLGFASRKANNQLFARFRETCDKFFAAKADFFKRMKDDLAANLEKKIALCERAEALKDSTDWKKTADALVALQQEWKSVGSVAKKHSDAVWNRFLAACDYFFEQRKKNASGTRQVEQANLKQKQQIIDELKAITDETPREDAVKTVRDCMSRWQQIGHVPFKEKDKVYDTYRALVNDLYERLDMRGNNARMASFESAVAEMGDDSQKLYRERERLVRAYDQKRQELNTYENNMGFFNAKSKSGSSMLKEMERKIQRIKDDITALEQKIRLIDSKL
ncbi:MAG: DUF349 domain-containing protein [Pseudoflavonifractor sp.]|nr:DUF349 domain-containing protein [Pseudoflavonifractor sp.]